MELSDVLLIVILVSALLALGLLVVVLGRSKSGAA